MPVLITRDRVAIPARVASGAAIAAAALPAASWGTEGPRGALITSVAAISISVTVAIGVARLVPRPRLAWLGALVVAACALLVAVTPRGVITIVIGALAGVGIGLVEPVAPLTRALRDRLSMLSLIAALAVGAVLLAGAGATAALWWATLLAATAAIVTTVDGHGRRRADPKPRRTLGVGIGAAAWTVVLLSWVAANTPTVNWFGGTISHGPRSGHEVAVTFDDGPDDPYTLAVRDILDAHRVKATFFTVGKALDARPDITRALYDDGQLLGDHSYHHDYWRWLDPRYRELARTQDAFQRQLGVCPAFFRPPHGQHTPFMSWLVHRDGMSMITWDVSAADWSSTDGPKVAADVLARARPGSIILLHDGLDGTVHANRSVLLTALPLIIDGLRQRGLEPVRLDQLLGRPGYVPC
jgi:peptidoglycan/xylan/chitin deacetylase (PgdA/CDA1 family)